MEYKRAREQMLASASRVWRKLSSNKAATPTSLFLGKVDKKSLSLLVVDFLFVVGLIFVCGYLQADLQDKAAYPSFTMSFAPGLDAGSIAGAAEYLSRPADEYVNSASVESMWVMRAIEYAEVHFNLISSVDPTLLKLTKEDDDRIYSLFLKDFPNFDVRHVTVETLKSESAKEKWREFCEPLKEIEDYSYGTLLRFNCLEDYTEENTILVTRIQFLAIEIARNRTGCNNSIYNKSKAVPS